MQIMGSSVVFKKVSPINNSMDMEGVTVRALEVAINGWARVLGLSVVTMDEASALLKRDEVQMRLLLKADHDPKTAGSCYIEVSDVEAMRSELIEKGASPGKIEMRHHGNKMYRVFFLVERDDGYCFCIGQLV